MSVRRTAAGFVLLSGLLAGATSALAATIEGDEGANRLTGTARADVIRGADCERVRLG